MDIRTFTDVIRFEAKADDGQYAGSVELTPWGDDWLLFMLYVPPKHRRAGVARKLVDQALAFAGSRNVYVEPMKWGDGEMSHLELVAWYMRLGFERTAQPGIFGHFARQLAEAC